MTFIVGSGMWGSPGLSMVVDRCGPPPPEVSFVGGTWGQVLTLGFVAVLVFTLSSSFSVVLSFRAGESFSNALPWKFVWVYCNLPTIEL